MNTILVVLVLLLVASTASRLTCAETAREQLQPLENCTLRKGSVVCGEVPLHYDVWTISSFKILEQVNSSQTFVQFCLGFKMFYRNVEEDGSEDICEFNEYIYFNSSLAVGVLTVDRNCWETERLSECFRDVTVLEEVLELGIIKYYPDREEFWNFESSLFGTRMHWMQTLSVFTFTTESCNISAEWISNLRNTSISHLDIYGAKCSEGSDGFLLKDMPYLQKLVLNSVCIKQFRKGSFTGTRNLEEVTIRHGLLTSMPSIVTPLPKLKSLHTYFESIDEFVFIEDKTLPHLHNLEHLDMSHIAINNVLDQFPILSKLKHLMLSYCNITTLERDAFRNISLLQTLDLSYNNISNIHEEAFLSLRNLRDLNLRDNRLVFWPVIYFCSLLKLDLGFNKLTGLRNPSVNGTTTYILNMDHNNIYEWDDVDIFNSNGMRRRNLFEGESNVVEYNSRSALSTTNNAQSYNSMYTEDKWVRILDVSFNKIYRITDIMLKSMDGLDSVKLSGSLFDCRDCTVPQLQKWINTTKTNVDSASHMRCDAPHEDRNKPVMKIEFDLEACIVKTPNYWIITGVPLGIICSVVLVITVIYFHFRSKIVYMLHLYSIRKQKSPSTSNCNFDAFVCYSSRDRRFVLTALVPLLENCPERYRLCLHERDFVLGSHIVDNIVGAIEHSRKIILVLSPHFISSKFCNWELEMANHKMFDDDKQFLILIQVAHIDPDTIPRHLKFFMDTRTFLNWTQKASESAVQEMGRQLKKSLGYSIFQSSRKQPLPISGARVV